MAIAPMDPVEELELLRLVLDNIHNGVLVTDPQGRVMLLNTPYARFLGVKAEEQLGKHCTEVVENSRMHIVAETGIPEINQRHEIKGQTMVVQRIPIWKDGKVIAVFGQVMFKDVRDLGKLAKKLSLLESKVKLYEDQLLSLRSSRYTLDSIAGESRAIRDLKKEAVKAASNNLPVLITGESGTGKELFAHAIHHASPRRFHAFVRINCSAIPRDLFESELFGYERGAFTGACSGGKPGKLELAHHGSVFLDEIGDLPLEMQPKLLRVLEEKELERVGGTTVVPTDFRLIAASNQDLELMVSEGKFRKDLFYRLNVIRLHIPPLRERREDILPLANRLLKSMAEDSWRPQPRLDPKAQEALQQYAWPGNVRELTNVLERALSSTESEIIGLEDLPFYVRGERSKASNSSGTSLWNLKAQAEREAILQALQVCGQNRARAARLLGIHRTLLYKKMRRHGIPTGKNSNSG